MVYATVSLNIGTGKQLVQNFDQEVGALFAPPVAILIVAASSSVIMDIIYFNFVSFLRL